MDFELNDEQAELQRSVRAVLERECPPSIGRRVVETGEVPEQPWRSARELGWTAICVPERWGGLSLSFEELSVVVEEHGRALAPGPFLATVTQFLPLVRHAADDPQRDRFLPALAAGELTGALAMGGAWRRDGRGFVLEGSCPFVLDGETADEIAVAAEGEGGVALFVVPREAVKSERVESLDATRPLASLSFERVAVGPDRMLAGGANALARALAEATAALAIEMVGCCRSLFDLVLAHVKQREQFGRPIGAFQAVQHKCADLFVAIEKARATAAFAAMTIAEDDPRRALAVSMAKVSAGACQRLVCQEAIQLHGGQGFTWESDVHLYVKRARTGEGLLGSSREHRARIGELLSL